MAIRRDAAPSTLDVLENFFGAIPTEKQLLNLRPQEIDQLCDLVMEFSMEDEMEAVPPQAVYPGAWIAGSWHLDVMQPELNQCLLYQDAIVTHDPIADYFGMRERWLPELRPIRAADGSMSIEGGPKLWNAQLSYESMRDNLDQVRGFLASLIPYIFDLSPMIKKGVIIPRPQWKTLQFRQQPMLASVRNDTKNELMTAGAPRITAEIGAMSLWDNLQGMHIELDRPAVASDERWQWQYEFFQLAKQLAFSDQYSTVYVPQNPADLELLRLKIGTLDARQNNQPRAATLDEITRFAMPDLTLSAKTAVKIRKNDEAFEAWRRAVRKIDRDSVNDDAGTLRQRVEDELTPMQKQIEKSAFGASLKSHATNDGLGVVLASVGQYGTALATDQSLDPAQMLGPMAVGGVLGWLWSLYRRPRAVGEARILNSLQRSLPLSQDLKNRRLTFPAG